MRLRGSLHGKRNSARTFGTLCWALQPEGIAKQGLLGAAILKDPVYLGAMPELPDITIYLEALRARILGEVLLRAQIMSPFVLRTVLPPIIEVEGKKVIGLRRLGKRIVFGFENDLYLMMHLMVAGRLHWMGTRTRSDTGKGLACFHFPTGCLSLTEAGTRKRASLHLGRGERFVQSQDPGGLEVLGSSLEDFSRALTENNHTLKRALTDPHIFSGIGNAYADEILHAAHLSPVAWTQRLAPDQIERLHRSAQTTLNNWIEILRENAGGGFPEKVIAFRPEMAVHGKFRQPCPVCGTRVQRIRYAENETNYCPNCQTGGRLLADRSLSLLLKQDWPRTVEEMEELRSPAQSTRL